jgi:hypothetical protein
MLTDRSNPKGDHFHYRSHGTGKRSIPEDHCSGRQRLYTARISSTRTRSHHIHCDDQESKMRKDLKAIKTPVEQEADSLAHRCEESNRAKVSSKNLSKVDF